MSLCGTSVGPAPSSYRQVTAVRAQKMEATTGFEPVNRGFAGLYPTGSVRVRSLSERSQQTAADVCSVGLLWDQSAGIQSEAAQQKVSAA